MIPISEIASYRDIPVFGWLSNEESLDDKDKASTLVRTIYPLSQVGKVNLFFLLYCDRIHGRGIIFHF